MMLYIYSKCSTCQKAVRFLEQKKVNFQIKEIVKTPPSIEELQRMLKYQDGNLKKLFNTSGQLYKDMQLKEKLDRMSIDQAFDLLNQHGMLVKRPFLITDQSGLTGFNEKEWMQTLGICSVN